MLDIARPEARADVRANPKRATWGPVDVILAVVMLPFGIWFLVIDRMVAAAAWLLSLGSPRPSLAPEPPPAAERQLGG